MKLIGKCVLAAFVSLATTNASAGEPVQGINISIPQCPEGKWSSATFGGSDLTAIPAGSFGLGSPAFTDTIDFTNSTSFQIERLDDASFAAGVDTIDIELTGVQWASSTPIAFFGAIWDLEVSLSAPATGQMTLDQDLGGEGGSVLSASLSVPLVFTFSSPGLADVIANRTVTTSLVGGPVGWENPVGDPTGLRYLDNLEFASAGGDFHFQFQELPEPTSVVHLLMALVAVRIRHRSSTI